MLEWLMTVKWRKAGSKVSEKAVVGLGRGSGLKQLHVLFEGTTTKQSRQILVADSDALISFRDVRMMRVSYCRAVYNRC